MQALALYKALARTSLIARDQILWCVESNLQILEAQVEALSSLVCLHSKLKDLNDSGGTNIVMENLKLLNLADVRFRHRSS